ncbi:DsbA family oxidoreductase [Pedobacter sp. HDW13]|uniref:DsbA family oxidoreductase n=1 Tax=unclassified Pedobacter TaxID=2628915 RepID=UPI000F5AC07A|nr:MULTISPECIES: DsbA family oxidoreductase [unclassified Pedobacter]QIL39483.1 DsbA family oxidoreductase [Pedobacter sp. HDW13]RQO78631.1 disulfide bond formation protein DsbA [Pedobacter sp. KBW01]
MKVEIWSDVMCPFCYIGKRHFEQAIETLPFKNEIEVDWKSYQLNPEYHNTNNETVYDYLSRSKGMPVEQARQMTKQVVDMAANAGLTIDFDTNIPANTFNAHRLIHLAAKHNLQDLAEEKLFEAHFVKAKNIGETSVLVDVAIEIGLDKAEAEAVLAGDQFAEAVRYDIYESQNLGIRGVPYFVMDRKYGVSGAQPIQAFTEALTQSFKEWKEAQPKTKLTSLNKTGDAICDENGCEI